MTIDPFKATPGLANELRERDWRRLFDRKTLQRAEPYANPTRMIALDVLPVDDAIVALAIFVGNYAPTYDARLRFYRENFGGWGFDAECSCPVAYECKHIAAALMAITDELDKFEEERPSAGPPCDSRVADWMSMIHDSLLPPPPEEETSSRGDTFLAYCLQPSKNAYQSSYQLALHTARTLKSGKVKINLKTQANADPYRPPKYLAREDFLPCTLFSQLRNITYFRGGVALDGPQAGLLLKQALETGRLFFVADESTSPLSVTSGEPVALEPIWKNDEDGSVRPTFAPPFDEAAMIIETDPPHLLGPGEEPGILALHPLDTTRHGVAFLEAWTAGPALKPEEVATVATRFQEDTPSLPAPVPAQSETLEKGKPVRHLHLHRANPFSHGGLHLSGQPEPIIATLVFEYHGHSLTPDLAAELPDEANFIASSKGNVYTIPRDTAAEREALALLADEHHFVPAGAIDPQVAPHHSSALLPDTEPTRWDAAAAEFITRSVPRLEEQGWQVSLDSSANLEIHAIGPDDLDTGLSELPEQGIDWFQFSASYLTPSGAKQPLLPLLSPYLRHLDFENIDDTIAELPEGDQTYLKDPDDPNSFLSFPTARLLRLAKSLHELFGNNPPEEPLHRLQAAALADSLEMDSSQTLRDLADLGNKLGNVTELPQPNPPKALKADLRDYQLEGFHWMQFLARHSLHGILADDMGLGKTIQTLTHLQAEVSGRRTQKTPSLVIAPTSVVGNWQAEAKKFTPKLKTLLLQGPDRREHFKKIPEVHLVITSYALLVRDFEKLKKQEFHLVILDEAQYIKNPAAKVSQLVCKLQARHRLSLSGTPLENHLGELWSQMRFLMPGLLGSSEVFNKKFRTPIEKHSDPAAQAALNSRVAPLILRRTKEAVAKELPPKTEILHTIALNAGQVDIYETVRAAMDERVREAIADKGLAKSQIIVLDALLKLRQICCHPQLLKLPAAKKVRDSAKLDFLTTNLLPTLLEEGRRILIFSSFTTMLALIEKHLDRKKVPFSKITGSTRDRQQEIEHFQAGDTPVFLISLKAGGTGLNLTAADTVIHYDPWWNPAAENQATDRAYRIGQDKPVFVHKLITEGSIEERIVQLQSQKAKLVEALLSEKTSKLKLDQETLGNLLAPLE